MRVSELSARSGVSVPTIKFYLREGLLPPGERTSATQARYEESHVSRLQLVRALLGVGGLSVATAKRVLAVHDDPPADVFEAIGTAQLISQPPVEKDAEPEAGDQEARELVARLGWELVDPEGPELRRLSQALTGLRDGGIQLIDGGVERYARWIEEIASAEIDTVPRDDPADAIRQAVLGTVLVEPLLVALRRIAHQDLALRRLAGKSEPGRPSATLDGTGQ